MIIVCSHSLFSLLLLSLFSFFFFVTVLQVFGHFLFATDEFLGLFSRCALLVDLVVTLVAGDSGTVCFFLLANLTFLLGDGGGWSGSADRNFVN